MPPGAADCHMHVIGPVDRFPLAAERAYTVPEASLAEHEAMKRRAGLERTVFVQLSGHGTDNRALCWALEQVGERGRGVAVVDLNAKNDLEGFHRKGVRALRLNLATLKTRYGSNYGALVREHEQVLGPLGWHLQVFADIATLLSMKEALLSCAVPVVIDHMGLPDAALGVQHESFQAVLEMATAPHVWVKLAGADRITRSSGRLRDAIPFMQALAKAAPQRLVWGSDWPHLGFHAGTQVHDGSVLPFRKLEVAELLSVLSDALTAQMQKAVLADNPARLYGFNP